MGRFIISRSAAGERFLLQSENGQVLAASRTYATLDACKKGIASLIVHAPIMPVRDLTAGEGGPNPKCEIVASGTGFAYRVKAANGKVVVSSGTYATKKACLRAIAMLRNGVENYEILFERQAGLVPLVMKPPTGAKPKIAPDAPKSPIYPVGTGVPDCPPSPTNPVGTGVPDCPSSPTIPVGTGVPDCPSSPTHSVVDNTPADLPKSLTKTKKASNGVENAPLDLSILDEIEETAEDPVSTDLFDEETASDASETAKKAPNGAQNADLAAEIPVGGGTLDAPRSPIHLVGTGVPDCPPSPTHSADNVTPPSPPKPEVKTPRLVRLTPERATDRTKAASKAAKVPPRKRGLFDRFFKK